MDTFRDGYTSPMVDQGHVTQGQQPQEFGHVDSAYPVTQEAPPPPGDGESWPGYPGPEAPPAIYLEPQETSPKTYADYRQRASTVLGAFQVTAALISMILNIPGIGQEINDYFISSYAIWCSLFYIISGSLAIQAGKRAKRGVVIGSTAMSTMSAVIVWYHIIAAISSIADRGWLRPEYLSFLEASLGLNSVQFILGILEFIVSVWTASLGCLVTCCRSPSTTMVTQTKVVYVQGRQEHSGQDGNTQRPVPEHPSAYPTYSTSSPECVYDTIPDDLREMSGQRMSCDTADVYLTTDPSSPAGGHHYIQVIDQTDVGSVPPSSDCDYLQPETGTIPDVTPGVSGKRMSFGTTDVYLTTDHSSPAGGHHYIQVIDQPDVGNVPPSSDGDYLQPETGTIPDDLPEVSDRRMSCDFTDVYLTTDNSSPARGHHYIQVVDPPVVGGVPPSSDDIYPQPTKRGVEMHLITNTAAR